MMVLQGGVVCKSATLPCVTIIIPGWDKAIILVVHGYACPNKLIRVSKYGYRNTFKIISFLTLKKTNDAPRRITKHMWYVTNHGIYL